MSEFTYPAQATIEAIAQDKMARLQQDRPVFKKFPIVTKDATLVVWEQLDNYQGLQQIRGMNGEPPSISKTGIKQYTVRPGIYGEFDAINEQEMMERRRMGTFGTPIKIDDLTMMSQDKLLLRRLDRIEAIIWMLLSTGTFAVSDPTGKLVATDTFPIQTFAAAYSWSNAANATPLGDLRQVQLDARGHSVSFGASAEIWMNQKTWNNMINNINPADLYGRRTTGLGTINNLAAINQLLAGDNLPTIVIYDEGYQAETTGAAAGTGVFTPFIPDNKVVVFGKRPAGQVIGEYMMVRNVNNPNMAPGPYMRVIDKGVNQIPRTIEVHDGHNGAPGIYFPSAIVVMSV
jgi:hypothetical protein